MPYPKIYVKLLNNVLTSLTKMTKPDNSKQAYSFEKWHLCLLLNSGWDVTVGRGCWLVWYWCMYTLHWSVSALWCASWWTVFFVIEWQGVINASSCWKLWPGVWCLTWWLTLWQVCLCVYHLLLGLGALTYIWPLNVPLVPIFFCQGIIV